MKFAVILALVLSVSICMPVGQNNTPQQKEWSKLKDGFSWAKVILNFAELKNMSGGALDDLAEAITNLIADLNNKSVRVTNEYQERTVLHESETKRLQGEIDDANLNIAETTEFLDNVLYVQKNNLIQTIDELGKNIEKTGQYIEDEKALREKQHRDFNTKMAEHQDAITAIDECQVLLKELNNSDSLVFAQVDQAKEQVNRVHAKLKNNADSSMVQALVSLASQDFADQQTLGQVVELLNQVKTNLIGSMAHFSEEEDKAQKAHEEDIQNKSAEINRMILEKTDSNAQLERTNEQIEDNEAFVKERQEDLQDWTDDLDDENSRFQTATENFNALIEQINKELEACTEASNLIENSNFAGYIEDRADQNIVVDQPHGDGISVAF